MSRPLITYFLNCMGPINKKWIEENGGNWSAGRIDIHDPASELPYNESYGRNWRRVSRPFAESGSARHQAVFSLAGGKPC